VDEQMGHVLGARAELKHRQNLGARIDGQPQPEDLFGTPQPCAQFIQLHVRELEVAEIVRVKGLSVLASTREPGGDGGRPGAEDPRGRRRIQPFRKRREDHGDLLGRGFQPVQRGVESSTEGGATRLTTERLDALETAMLAIPDERVNLRIGVCEVGALRVGTGVTLGIDAFGSTSPAFDLAPGAYRNDAIPNFV